MSKELPKRPPVLAVAMQSFVQEIATVFALPGAMI